MTLKEMKDKLNALASEMSTLGQKPERTADEETRLDAVMVEFNEFAPKVERELQLDASRKRAGELAQSTGSVTELDGQSGEQGEKKTVDRRSLGERFATSQEIKNYLSSGDKRSEKFKAGKVLIPRYDDGPQEQFASSPPIVTGNPVYLVPPDVAPGIRRPRDYALTARDVLASGRTTSDTIYFVRELLFTNNAAEVAQSTAFDPTAASATNAKPYSTLTFEQASAPVVTVAHWTPITRQAIADSAQLQSYVENRLLVGLDRRINSQIVNGTGAGATMTGLLGTSGIQVADAAYFAGAAVNDVGTDNEVFNRILRGITLTELVGDAQATFVMLNPYDLEVLQTSSDAMRAYLAGGPFAASPVPRVWGLPIARDRAVPRGTGIVGDGTMAQVWDREDANILIDTIMDQFIHNMLTILAEARLALTVFRPAAFVNVTLGTPTS